MTGTPRAALGVAAALLVVGAVLLPRFDRMYPVPSKGLVDFALAVDHSNYQEPSGIWTANSRIDLLRGAKDAPRVYAKVFTQGSNTVGLPLTPHAAGIAQDATAGTTMLDYSRSRRGSSSCAARCTRPRTGSRNRPGCSSSGLGGGNDAWAAKLNKARSVKAVELNWPIVALHQKVMRDFSRNLVEDPHVELVVGEGRSALMRDTNHYDVIQMTGIDTWTALASGAYVLAENYLYTREAIESMYSHLAPGGILQISRFAEAMEALRMISNMHAALEHLGAADHFEDCIQATRHRGQDHGDPGEEGALHPGRTGLDREVRERSGDPRRLSAEGRPRGPRRSVHPRARQTKAHRRLPDEHLADGRRQALLLQLREVAASHRVRAAHRRHSVGVAGQPDAHLEPIFVSIVLSALLIVYPIARRSDVPKKGKGRYFVYFAGLGLGFIFIEVGAIQKLTLFLGQPVYSLTVTLFSLLVFTGLGSLLFAGRLLPGDRRIWAVPLGIAIFIAIFLGGSSLFVSHLIGLPVGVRIAPGRALALPDRSSTRRALRLRPPRRGRAPPVAHVVGVGNQRLRERRGLHPHRHRLHELRLHRRDVRRRRRVPRRVHCADGGAEGGGWGEGVRPHVAGDAVPVSSFPNARRADRAIRARGVVLTGASALARDAPRTTLAPLPLHRPSSVRRRSHASVHAFSVSSCAFSAIARSRRTRSTPWRTPSIVTR